MKRADARIKAALVLGLVLGFPVVRGYLDGTIELSAAVVRVAIGLALAYAGVSLVVAVVKGYLPEPEEEPQPEALDGVEEAVLVQETTEPSEADQL